MEELILNNFKGVNESIHSELIQDNELTVLKDAILSSDGRALRITKRKGYTRVRTDEATATGDIKGIFGMPDKNSDRIGIFQNGILYLNSMTETLIWVAIKTGILGDKLVKLVREDNFYFLDGKIKPFYTNAYDSFDIELPKPDVTNITTSHDSIGALTADSVYKYCLVYLDKYGQRSAPSTPITHFVSTTGGKSTDATNKCICLSNISFNPDTRITNMLVYRTQANGDIYYRLPKLYTVAIMEVLLGDRLQITDTEFVDKSADTDLDLSDTIDYILVPITAQQMTIHNERLFMGNITFNNRTLVEPAHTKVATLPPAGYTNGYGISISQNATIGNIDPGVYKYKIVFTHSNKIPSEGIDLTITIVSPNKMVEIANLPFLNNKFALGVEYVSFYRTTAGSSDYYLLNKYAVDYFKTQTGFQDTLSDIDLVGNEALLYETIEYKSGIVYSEISNFSSIRALNFINVFPDYGDEITAMFDDGNGITIFKRNSIYKLYTLGSPANWELQKISESFGCDNPNAICKNGQDYFIITNKRAYIFSGQFKEVGETFKTSLSAITTINAIEYYKAKGWYVIACQVSSSNFLYIYDTILDTWYKFGITKASCLLNRKSGIGINDLWVGDGKYIVKYDELSEVDNEAGVEALITPLVRTKTFNFKDGIAIARLRILYMTMLKSIYDDTIIKIYDVKTDTYNQHTIIAESADIVDELGNVLVDELGNKIQWFTGDTDDEYSKIVTDSMEIMNVRETSKIYFELTGAGLLLLDALKLKYRSLARGRR